MNKKTKSNISRKLEEIYEIAQKGISREDKTFLLNEIDDMVDSIEKWKAKQELETSTKQ